MKFSTKEVIKMFDVHCHLEYIENPEQVIQEAKQKDCRFCSAVSDLKDVRKVLKLGEDNDNVFIALGLHPERALKYENLQLDDYEKIIRENVHRIVAIGEIGLDYAWVKEPKKQERTKEIFCRFLHIAKELNKPVVIHCRDAFDDCLQILKQELDSNTNVILHFFSGNKENLKECLERGYWISYNTIAVRSKSFRKLIKKTPIDKLLLETDAPWCDPRPRQENKTKESNESGTSSRNATSSSSSNHVPLTNVPWNIQVTAELVARLKDMTVEEVLQHTEENAKKALGIN